MNEISTHFCLCFLQKQATNVAFRGKSDLETKNNQKTHWGLFLRQLVKKRLLQKSEGNFAKQSHGWILRGIFWWIFWGLFPWKKMRKKSTSKFKSEFGIFAAKIHTAGIWPLTIGNCPRISVASDQTLTTAKQRVSGSSRLRKIPPQSVLLPDAVSHLCLWIVPQLNFNFQKTREGCGCFWGLCGSSGGKLRESPGKIAGKFFPNYQMLQILGFRASGKANLPGTLGQHSRDFVPTFRAGCFLKSTVPAFSSFSETWLQLVVESPHELAVHSLGVIQSMCYCVVGVPPSALHLTGAQPPKIGKSDTVRTEMITELILESAGPLIFKTFLTGTNSFQTDSSNLSCKKSKAWNCWKW